MGELFKNQRLFMNLIILTILWTTSSFNYYLINFQLKYIEGNIFLNTICSSSSEIAAYICGGYIFAKLGLKTSFSGFFLLAATGSSALLFVHPEELNAYALATLVLISKAGVSATFVMLYVSTP